MENEVLKEQTKIKRWEHFPVRPETFEQGKAIKADKGFKSYNALIAEVFAFYLQNKK